MSAQLPDITSHSSSQLPTPIDWVGMSGIDHPISIIDASVGERQVHGKVDVYVNLADANAKGIHMSRLYLGIQSLNKPVSGAGLAQLLGELMASQAGLSNKVKLSLRFEWLMMSAALLSGHSGWKSYQVELHAWNIGGNAQLELAFEVKYSSTCPCSAALSRALIADNFHQQFGQRQQVPSAEIYAWLNKEEAINATPHSQRSVANCRLRWHQVPDKLPISASIGQVEQALSTAVQTAVKRQDEQEFARLNAKNLMFCEDAVRRLRAVYQTQSQISDYLLQVRHMESLHAHDAVASICKGVPGGLQA